MNDLITVITPMYNSQKFISSTINSVLNQTYPHWEMIIVDDYSIDNSVQIVEKYIKEDSRIKLIKLEKNSGPAIARNVAIKEAKGRYIAFLDSDDLWLPEKLERQVDFMQKNDLAFTYSSYKLITEDGKLMGDFIVKQRISYNELLKGNIVGCLTAIYDVQKVGKIFMPNILKRQDYGLWLKILKKIKETRGILEPLAIYRIRRNSVSSNKFKAAYYQWRIYREVEKLKIIKSVYYFIHYIFHGLGKYNKKIMR